MRILYLGNNRLGWKVLSWLQEQGEQLVGLVIHPPEERRFGEEMLSCIQLADDRIFEATQLDQPSVRQRIRELRPEIGISVLFGRILRAEFLKIFPSGCLNLHPALLPYNRGAYPNVWSIVEGTPAGVTLHYMDQDIDTGDIVAQREVEVEAVDSGGSLYRKLEVAALEMFRDTWPLICSGRAPRIPQEPGTGTFHRLADVDQIDEIDLDSSYTARELIDVLRARTFPPHKSAYLREGNRKIYLRLELFSEDEPEKD